MRNRGRRQALKSTETLRSDVLVIGGGGAGLRAAIAAREKGADVLLVSKYRTGLATNTFISKAIIAASGWGAPEDDGRVHADDFMKGGRFLNDPSKVAEIAGRIGPEIAFLRDCGVKFGMTAGRPRLLRTPGHAHPRHLHGENWTGGDLVFPLIRRAEAAGVRTRDHVFVTRLLTSDGHAAGAAGITPEGDVIVMHAGAVVLAAGGYARIFLNSNNASGVTGDGLALAYAAGAALQDMEFVQFYPTATGRRGNRLLLYENLLARQGVVLRNSDGEDVIRTNGVPDPARSTRAPLARLIMKEIMDDPAGRREIFMDLSALPWDADEALGRLLPSSWGTGQKRFKIAPTAHFCMGGVVADQQGKTDVDGLFAVGEVASGAHGANRLSGNALAEIFALGALAGSTAADAALNSAFRPPAQDMIDRHINRLDAAFSENGAPPRELIRELKTLMWRNAGVIREKTELEEALAKLRRPRPRMAVTSPRDLIRRIECDNMRLLSEMVCTAALQRTESRGAHYRVDFPEEDNDNWLKNIVFRKGADGLDVEVRSIPGALQAAPQGLHGPR